MDTDNIFSGFSPTLHIDLLRHKLLSSSGAIVRPQTKKGSRKKSSQDFFSPVLQSRKERRGKQGILQKLFGCSLPHIVDCLGFSMETGATFSNTCTIESHTRSCQSIIMFDSSCLFRTFLLTSSDLALVYRTKNPIVSAQCFQVQSDLAPLLPVVSISYAS